MQPPPCPQSAQRNREFQGPLWLLGLAYTVTQSSKALRNSGEFWERQEGRRGHLGAPRMFELKW